MSPFKQGAAELSTYIHGDRKASPMRAAIISKQSSQATSFIHSGPDGTVAGLRLFRPRIGHRAEEGRIRSSIHVICIGGGVRNDSTNKKNV